MSGGGSVRTTYKGKATFDDIMSKATLYLGIAFMGLVLLYNVFSVRATAAQANLGGLVPVDAPVNNEPPTNSPVTNAPVTNEPVTNAPVTNAPVTNAPVTNEPVTNAPATNAPATNTPK